MNIQKHCWRMGSAWRRGAWLQGAMRQVLMGLALAGICVSPLLAQEAPSSSALGEEMEQAHAALQAHDAQGAKRHFEAVLRLDPGNAEAHVNLGVMAFFAGRCDAAEPHLRAAIGELEQNANPQALLALCELRDGKPEAAADLEASWIRVKEPKLHVQIGLELARLYRGRGDTARMMTVLQALTADAPDNLEVLFFAQQVYTDLADETLNKMALLAPGAPLMQQVIAEKLVNQGDLARAIEHYHKALDANPHLPGANFELAEALLDGPHTAATEKAAREQLDLAVKNGGDSAAIECVYGRLEKLLQHPAEARMHYERAHELDPNNAEALLYLAGALADEDKQQEALVLMRAAVAADPFDAAAHYRLARLCGKLQLKEEEERQIRLSQEVRQAKEQVVEVFRQMNRRVEPVKAQEENTP